MKRAALSALIASLFVLVFVSGSAARTGDYLYEIDGIQSLAPNTHVQLFFELGNELGTESDGPLHVQFYRLSPALALEAIRKNSDDGVPSDTLKRATRLSEFSTNERLAEDAGVHVVDLGRLPIGVYAARVQYGSATVSKLLNISTLGMVRATQGTETVLWAVDLRAFRTHAGPTQAQLLGDSQINQVAFVDGIGRHSGSLGEQAAFFATTADGSIALDRFNAYDETRPELTYFRTDRPLYRPGQTVHFRAVLRSGVIGAYVVPHGMRRVRVSDPNGSSIYEHSFPVDSFGSVHGDLNLPEDAQLGWYQIQLGSAWQGGFDVEAYKKPEYEISVTAKEPVVLRGDRTVFDVKSAYFFGRPAAGLHIHYSAYSSGYGWYEASPYDRFISIGHFGSQLMSQGDGVSDDGGEYHITFRAPKVDAAESIRLEVEGRDASGRTVSTSTYATIVPALVRVDIAPSEWFAQPGEKIGLKLRSADYAGHARPNLPISLSIVRTTWNKKDRLYDELSRQIATLQSGADGSASYSWTPGAGGTYEIRAQALDERGNTARSTLPFWVASSSEGGATFGDYDQPAVIAAKGRVSPAERPRVLIALPRPDRDVLVTVSSDRLVSARVVHIAGYAASYAFDPPRDARHLVVTVSLPQENGVESGVAGIEVSPAAKVLRVSVSPSKHRYVPGERAEFNLHVTDAQGRPVRAQLDVGIIDAALLALTGESGVRPIADTFYGSASGINPDFTWSQPNRKPVRTIARVTAHASGRLFAPSATADVYAVGQQMRPRSNFADTAYWTPSVVTDVYGNANVQFTWPDNLTRWVATSEAVTTDTGVGDARATALVTKDFLVRLETPRFIRRGDTVTFVGIAHGMAGSPRVRLNLDLGADPLETLLTLDHTLTADAAWTVDAGQAIGARTFTLSGSDGQRSDAMRLTIPVEAVGTAEHLRDAGRLSDRSGTTLVLPAGYESGPLRVMLTPSLVAQLVQDVRLLDIYPYYCTEQTMSAALPAVFVDRVLARTHIRQPQDIRTGSVVRKAVLRLQQLQHGDGSWGWWENDPGHPFMTAYALYGLAEFRHAGYDVPQNVYTGGVDSLVGQLGQENKDTLAFWGGAQRGSEWDTRAFMLFALADAAPARVNAQTLRQTDEHVDALNAYAIAVLGLAHHMLGQDAMARSLLEKLNARAIQQGPYTYWSGQTWHYAWEDDPIETTAYALRLNAALQPHSGRIQRIVDFLRAEQHGSWWYTTKDTSAAIYAISEAVPTRSDEFAPNEAIDVSVGDKLVRTVRIDRPVLDAAQAEIVVPASLVRDGTAVTFSRRGRGELYWATDWTRYAPPGSHSVADPNRSLLTRLFPQTPPLDARGPYSRDWELDKPLGFPQYGEDNGYGDRGRIWFQYFGLFGLRARLPGFRWRRRN